MSPGGLLSRDVQLRAALGAALLTGLVLLLYLFLPLAPDQQGANSPAASPVSEYGELPLGFSPNTGSQPAAVEFSTSTDAGSVALTRRGAVIAPSADAAAPVRMTFEGSAVSSPAGLERLPGVVNDFRGKNPSDWRTNVPTFGKVTSPGVYPGIDVDYHGRDGTLEYDFRVAPGADPSRIGVDFGRAPVRAAAGGDLVIGRGDAAIRQRAPVAYQSGADGREPVSSRFEIDGGVVGFELGAYDRSRALVIDPLVIAYSTYLGGAEADYINAIALDGSNNAYVAGATTSTDFPTQGAYQGAKAGPAESDYEAVDAFVTKLNPSGSAIVYSTYLGGARNDEVQGVAVDSNGSAYLGGETYSDDFPVTAGAFQTAPGKAGGYKDAFVAKLNASGNALSYSTRLAGTGGDEVTAIDVDSSGAAYVTGITGSYQGTDQTPFPVGNTIPGGGPTGYQHGDSAFVTKLNGNGTNIVYSSYVTSGGQNHSSQGQGIAVDSTGHAYITGNISGDLLPTTASKYEGDTAGNSSDGFFMKLGAGGNSIDYSTYFGGTSDDYPNDVAIDSTGRAFIAGSTQSGDGYDLKNQYQGHRGLEYPDAFLTEFDPSQSGSDSLLYSSILKGDSYSAASSVDIDAAGHAYIGGTTAGSSTFPAVDPISSDTGSAFVAKFDTSQSGTASLIYSSTIPSRTSGIAGAGVSGLAVSGTDVHVAGTAQNNYYPSTAGAFQEYTDSSAGYYTPDGFVSKITYGTGSDTTAPDTSITAGPASGSTTSDSTPTFEFSSTESPSSFECNVDGTGWGTCSSPYTTSTLGNGQHSFQVRATDGSNNTDQSPAAVTFTVDSGPPLDTTPPQTTIQGAASRVVKSRRLPVSVRFSFSSSEAGSSFRCKLDSGAYKSCSSPKSYSLGRGEQTLSVKATDQAGNEDPTADKVEVTVKKKH